MKTNGKIRLGLMVPLSGIVKLYGSEISNAGIIACNEVNEAGGVLGQELELIIIDDGSLPESAVPAAARLVNEFKCSAIIGNLLSNSRISVSNLVSEPLRIPYLNFSFYEGSISGKYFFHFAALPNQQIDRMIPYMQKEFGQKIFFAGNNYEWPRGSIDAGKKVLLDNLGEVVGEEYLPIGALMSDIEELLVKVSKSGADVFVPYFAGTDQINLLNCFTQKGLKNRMAVVMGHYDEAMVSLLSPEVREGFYSSNTYFMSIDSELNRSYLARLAKLDGIEGISPSGNGILTNFGEGTYLCVKAFAKAVDLASSINPDALVKALETIEIEGPQGVVTMDPTIHHATVNTYLSRCDIEGRFSIIKSFGRIAPVIPERYRHVSSSITTQPSQTTFHFVEKRGKKNMPEEFSDEAKTNNSMQNHSFNFIKNAMNQNECGLSSLIVKKIDIVIIAVDRNAKIIEANTEAYRQFGYADDELIGKSIHLLVPPNLRLRHAEFFEQFVQGTLMEIPMGKRGTIQGYRKDGTFFPAEAGVAKFFHEEQWFFVVTLRDISDRKRAEETLLWKATHDPLTKLPNRALIKERLHSALIRTTQSLNDVEQGIQNNAGVLFIDCDNFKFVNDTYGHDAGDMFLISVADRLINATRPGDTVARLGGDEFVVLCENIDSEQTISAVAKRINETMRMPFSFNLNSRKFSNKRQANLNDRDVYVSASIGVAIGHGSTHSVEDMLRNADAAMYIAKEQGKDGCHLFSNKVHENLLQKVHIISGLKTAIERNELHLVFQPIVATNSKVIKGAESLLRWNSSKGSVSPAIFIPVAESSGDIVSIGKWVFREACKNIARIQELYCHDIENNRLSKYIPYTSINVSTRQLNEEGIVAEFTEIMNETGAKPENIVIEITETSLMTDVNKNIKILNELAELGIRIAVDDFGTGYSSLLQLLRMPVSIIKIDREFIDGLDKKPESRAITSAVIKMANVMGKKVIAEGVENGAQLFELQAQGCDTIQGYYFYKPMFFDNYLSQLENEIINFGNIINHDSPAVYTVIYVSKASDFITQSDIEQLLEFSRKKNSELCITGFLLFNNGYFLQLLEGREEYVESLLKKIVADPRHRDVRIVLRTFNERRLFDDWTMGYWNMKASGSDIDFSEWQKHTLSLLEISNDARLCYAFFEAISTKNFS